MTKIAKPCNPHEAEMYHKIQKEPALLTVTPKFYGVRQVEVSDEFKRSFQTHGKFIILENLTASMAHACVMDVKVGTINYEVGHHDADKIRERKVKLTASTAGQYGVRLSGLRVYRPRTDNYLTRRSKYGDKNIHTKNQLANTIKLFLHDGIHLRTELIQPLVVQLSALLSALQKQTTFEFRSSSVLLIYDGSPSLHIPMVPPKTDVRLIDFDHAYIRDQNGPHDAMGACTGVKSLISILKKIGHEYHASQSESEIHLRKDAKWLKKKKHTDGTVSEDE